MRDKIIQIKDTDNFHKNSLRYVDLLQPFE